MKTCSTCKQEKSIDDFHKSSRSKDGKQSHCKDCNRTQRSQYYRTSKGKSSNDVSGKRSRSRNQQYVYNYLRQNQCQDCGEDDIVVLEFDHLRDKSFNISYGIRAGYSLQRIKDEIAKCEVVCANCHKRRTASREGWLKVTFGVDVAGLEPANVCV